MSSWVGSSADCARIVPAQKPLRSRYGSGLAPARAAPLAMLDASPSPRSLTFASPPSASSTGAACARSIARPAGRARTASRSSCSPPACSSASAAPLGHETLRLTDAGIAVLAETLAANRAPPRRPRAAGRARRARDDARRPPRLARPGVRAKVGDRLGHGDARRLLDPPHDGRGLRRADRPRGQGAARRPARRPAPRGQARGLPAARRRVLVRDPRRHRRPDEIPPECGVLVAERRRPRRRAPGAAAAGAHAASGSGWRWRGRRRSTAGASTTRRLPLGDAARRRLRRRHAG